MPFTPAPAHTTDRRPLRGPRSKTLPRPAMWPRRVWAAWITALSLAAFFVAGWHPYAEDGGMYVARVLLHLQPALFPHSRAFLGEPLRFTLFEPAVAAPVRLGLSLDWTLLLLQIGCIALTLCAARSLLRRLTPSEPAQLAGVALLAAWLTIPVAATSLLLTDPCLTARSLATPWTLFAVSFALGSTTPSQRLRGLAGCAICLLVAAAFHPLMAAYAALLAVMVLLAKGRNPVRWMSALVAVVFLAAAAVQGIARPQSSASRIADSSRYYWFLSQWRWYELAGIVCPLLILGWFALRVRPGFTAHACLLARSTIAFALTGVLLALCFAQQHFLAHPVARLQPLRVLSLIYALLPMFLGAALSLWTARILARPRSGIAALFFRNATAAVVLLSAAVFAWVQQQTFPASPHLEIPGAPARNAWEQAFQWAGNHTAPDALFALDADYVHSAGEDAQNFRAISRRSSLPDFSKDGGQAANEPALAPAWLAAVAAQRGLSLESPAERRSRLAAFAPDWIVVTASAPSDTSCPYRNDAVKVCRLAP